MADEVTANDDGVQHGIDDNPSGDAEKGATLGGVGGALAGAVAGAAAGPVGAVIGAVIGGVAGAVASGAAVAAVDRVDNDNTVTGLGGGATPDVNDTTGIGATATASDILYADTAVTPGTGIGTTIGAAGTGYGTGTVGGGGLGVTTGVNTDPDGTVGVNRLEELGETTPSIKTGGTANDGTPDTRGIGEKVVDAATGDTIDDKTGKVVDHP